MGHIGRARDWKSRLFVIFAIIGTALTLLISLQNVMAAAPTAVDDEYNTQEDTTLTVPADGVLSNDTDPDLDTLTAVLVDDVMTGALDLDGNGAFTYTPALNHNGIVTFSYQADDGGALSNVATVTITVNAENDAPVAVDDDYTTPEDTTLTIAASGVLTNDTDVENDPLSANLDTAPVTGELDLNTDGSLVYTPALDYNGVVTFSYFANDTISDSLTAATVSITVTAVNDPPIAVDDADATDEDSSISTAAPGVLTNDDDADDGDDPTVTNADTTSAAGASVTVNSDGSYDYDPTTSSTLNALAVSETLEDTFTYTIGGDSEGLTDTATVTVTVTGVNDDPTPLDDTGETGEDAVLNQPAPGVLDNDDDPDSNDTLTAATVDNPSNKGAVVSVNSDGSYSYDPTNAATLQALAVGETTTDTFDYEANDGNGGAVTATVAITVTGANDAPTAGDDTGATDEDSILNQSAPGVLANDSDIDASDTISVTDSDTASAEGAAVSVNNDGSYSYDPTGVTTLQSLAKDETAVDTFSYTLSDEHGSQVGATVTITVTGVNDAPTANDDTGSTNEDSILNGSTVLANDTDPDTNDSLSVTDYDSTSASGATVSVNGDGTYTYNPTGAAALQALTATESLDDTFSYTIGDGNGGSDTAVVTVTVSGSNDAPVLDNSGSLNLSSIDEDTTDPAGDTVATILASAGGDPITDADDGAVEGIAVYNVDNNNGEWQYSTNNGSSWTPFGSINQFTAVLLAPDALIRFVPDPDYNGSAGAVSFRAWDQTSGSNGDTGVNINTNGGTTAYSTATETASLTVTAVNDAPLLDDSGDLMLPDINEDDQTNNGDTVAGILLSDGGDRITDVDNDPEGIAVIGVDNSNGAWEYKINTDATWTPFSTVGPTNATLLISSARIRFIPDENYNGSAGNVTFRAWDLSAGSNGDTGADVSVNGGTTPYSTITETATLTVLSVNDEPVLDLNGGSSGRNYSASFTEDAGPTTIVTASLTLEDVEDDNFVSTTITLTNPLDGADESLAVDVTGTSITYTYNSTTGVLSLTGTDTRANYESVLRTLTYDNVSQSPGTTARAVDVVANDGIDDSNIPQITVSVTSVNDDPVLANNNPLTVSEASLITISTVDLEVTDVDNTPAQLEYTLLDAPDNGTLFLNSVALSQNDTFTQADINGGLLDYEHDGSETTSDSFNFSVADGNGGSIGATTFSINITEENDAPVVTTNTGLTLDEDTSATISDSHLETTDTDNTPTEITYLIEAVPDHGDLANDGTLLVQGGSFTQAEINNDRITYTHDGSETTSDSFTFTVRDGSGKQLEDKVFSITITPVNDLPVVDLNGADSGSGYAETFTEDGGTVTIVDTDLQLSDNDDTTLASATAALASFPDGTAESLSVNTGGTSIAASYNSSTGVLTLTGPDSLSNFQTVLRTLKYNNSSQNPNTTTRNVNVVVNDGEDASVAAVSAVTVVAQNDAPALATNAGLSLDHNRTKVIDENALEITDVDHNAGQLVITLESIPVNGTLLLNGSPLAVDDTFTQADINNGRLSYQHDGTETLTDSFTFSVLDGAGAGIGVTTFNITIGPKPKIYLPMTVKPHFFGEENDSPCKAYPINLNQDFQFYTEDTEDWYVFTLSKASTLSFELTDFVPAGDGQLVIYRGNCASLDFLANNGNNSTNKTITLNNMPPDTYFVRVFNDGAKNDTTLYTLRVNKP